jgi:hypothetical protein
MNRGAAILKTATFRTGEESPVAEFILCPSSAHTWAYGGPDAPAKDETIPVFYSTQHLLDSGWVYTTSREFAPPGRVGVWVCPECASEYKWESAGAA